jgi:hypothetical protein
VSERPPLSPGMNVCVALGSRDSAPSIGYGAESRSACRGRSLDPGEFPAPLTNHHESRAPGQRDTQTCISARHKMGRTNPTSTQQHRLAVLRGGSPLPAFAGFTCSDLLKRDIPGREGTRNDSREAICNHQVVGSIPTAGSDLPLRGPVPVIGSDESLGWSPVTGSSPTVGRRRD